MRAFPYTAHNPHLTGSRSKKSRAPDIFLFCEEDFFWSSSISRKWSNPLHHFFSFPARRTGGRRKDRYYCTHFQGLLISGKRCAPTVRSTFRRNITTPRVAIFDSSLFLHGLIAMLREKRRKEEENKKKDSHVLTRPLSSLPYVLPPSSSSGNPQVAYWYGNHQLLFFAKNSSKKNQPKYTGVCY